MTVLVPMTIEQDEDGWWCAHAQLGPNVGANGQGRTRKEALDDLREAVLASGGA
jgi:predicted RNase H-like HicB family nuclease